MLTHQPYPGLLLHSARPTVRLHDHRRCRWCWACSPSAPSPRPPADFEKLGALGLDVLGILGETPPTLRRGSVTLRRLRHGAANAGRRQGGNAEGAEACPPNTTLEGQEEV